MKSNGIEGNRQFVCKKSRVESVICQDMTKIDERIKYQHGIVNADHNLLIRLHKSLQYEVKHVSLRTFLSLLLFIQKMLERSEPFQSKRKVSAYVLQ